MFVIAGPTGSGKTSTLYRLLNNIAAEKLVLTIEDPVEIQQHQFIQLQVNTSAQMDYDALIKVALRHRPEVLLVGEIRDTATAKATIRAALSGHLVFSTVHAMSARDVVLRLLDLGIKSEQLKLALGGVVYQRLITTISGTQAALIDYLSEGLIKRIIAGESVEKFSNMWRETLQYALKHNIISKAVYETYKAI